MEGEAATIIRGLKWWRLFKNRNPALKDRTAQMCESQHADVKLTAEEWSGIFNDKLHLALLRVKMKAQHVYNQDESGYFRSSLVNIGNVWARKGRRWVARRRGYDRTHITTMVCVSVAVKTAPTALLWTGNTVHGRLFSKKACPVFIKVNQGDSKNDSRKATFSSDSNTQDSKPKQTGEQRRLV